MITLCTVCGQYHDSTACPNQHLSWHSKQGDQWKPLSQDDVMYWKIRVEKAESYLLSARHTIASLTAERDAWREDADLLAKWLKWWRVNNDSDSSIRSAEAIDHHRQLHERYPAEKSDTAKVEMK